MEFVRRLECNAGYRHTTDRAPLSGPDVLPSGPPDFLRRLILLYALWSGSKTGSRALPGRGLFGGIESGGREVNGKIKSNVKGDGQECPFQTCKVNSNHQGQQLRCGHPWFPPFGALRAGSFAKDAKDGAPYFVFADV